jgi:hypothetical protein
VAEAAEEDVADNVAAAGEPARALVPPLALVVVARVIPRRNVMPRPIQMVERFSDGARWWPRPRAAFIEIPVLDCGICKSSRVGLTDRSFSIRTKVGVTPKYHSNYRMSTRQELFLKDLTLHLQSRGIVEPCVSPWNSPVVLVPKKDSFRFTVDYSTGVNAGTENDAHPLPLIRPLLSEMASFRFFSKAGPY